MRTVARARGRRCSRAAPGPRPFLRKELPDEYHNGVTIEELLVQYESRLRELQVGLIDARFHNTVAAVVFAASAVLFLTLSVYAVRQQLSFLWASLPLPVAAASAYRCRRYR